MAAREQYPTVPPLVYGITPQESLADTDQESRKRGFSIFKSNCNKNGR